MTWEPGPRRRRKLYKGKLYVVPVTRLSEWSGLSLAATKEGSYQQANRWWMEHRAKIDSRLIRPLEPFAQSYVDELVKRESIARAMKDLGVADRLRRTIDQIRRDGKLPDDHFDLYYPKPGAMHRRIDDMVAELENVDDWEPNNKSEIACLNAVDPHNPIWTDRTACVDAIDPTPADKTVGGMMNEWLAVKRTHAESGVIEARSFTNYITLGVTQFAVLGGESRGLASSFAPPCG